MKFHGKIVSGRGIGRKLGFPTLNFEIPENLELENGVFAARLFLNEKIFFAILFFGNRKTFDDKKALEIHILENLVPSKARINESPHEAEFEILDKIRDVKKFEDEEDLKKQIEKDCALARKILGVR